MTSVASAHVPQLSAWLGGPCSARRSRSCCCPSSGPRCGWAADRLGYRMGCVRRESRRSRDTPRDTGDAEPGLPGDRRLCGRPAFDRSAHAAGREHFRRPGERNRPVRDLPMRPSIPVLDSCLLIADRGHFQFVRVKHFPEASASASAGARPALAGAVLLWLCANT